MARNPNGKGGGSSTKYKKEYCQLLIKHMSQGYSFFSFGAEVGCGKKTLEEWCEANEEFLLAKQEGHERARKYYETLANMKMRGIENKDFSAKKADTALIIFFLKTRFRDEYTERIDINNLNNKRIFELNYILRKEKNEEKGK